MNIEDQLSDAIVWVIVCPILADIDKLKWGMSPIQIVRDDTNRKSLISFSYKDMKKNSRLQSYKKIVKYLKCEYDTKTMLDIPFYVDQNKISYNINIGRDVFSKLADYFDEINISTYSTDGE